ncbi:MAG: hypothetical protein ACJA1C_000121 [Crocinitomicaceae bacterium]|jgi:hypothetical protein
MLRKSKKSHLNNPNNREAVRADRFGRVPFKKSMPINLHTPFSEDLAIGILNAFQQNNHEV